MKCRLLALTFLISMAQAASAQNHLIPDIDALGDPDGDGYRIMVRHVFAQAFEKEVTLRAIILPSFQDEYAVGLRVKDGAVTAFLIEPSSRIWDTVLVKLYETGQIKTFTPQGKRILLDDDESYKKLKRRTTVDYRKIKSIRQLRPIPKDVAEGIKNVWDAMLLNAKEPDEPILGDDGVTYHFSERLDGKRELSGHVWSPLPESKTGRLVALSDSLADFVRGKATLKELNARLEKATAP